MSDEPTPQPAPPPPATLDDHDALVELVEVIVEELQAEAEDGEK
jgi:predicted lipoprotein